MARTSSLMKNVILIPLMATGALLGCQESERAVKQENAQLEHQVQVPHWVGNYTGTTPCMGCTSRCDECPGMAVDLVLKQDHSYELKRESLSDHNDIETLTGRFIFKDEAQTKLELLNVKNRNLIVMNLEQQQLEIRVDESALPYTAQQDFILESV